MTEIVEAAVTLALALVGVALLAGLVSKNAQTPQVIQAAASGFGNSLAVAESPVTGSATHIDLSYPGTMFGFSPNLSIPSFG